MDCVFSMTCCHDVRNAFISFAPRSRVFLADYVTPRPPESEVIGLPQSGLIGGTYST